MRQIQVLQDFRGKFTGERLISAGIYDLSDDALYGQGQWLLDNGYAVPVGEWEHPTPPSEQETTPITLNNAGVTTKQVQIGKTRKGR